MEQLRALTAANTAASNANTAISDANAAISQAEADIMASTVEISMTGTGEAQTVSLSEAEVDALGEGTVMAAASQIGEHGNVQEVADAVTSFVIDTIDPSVASVENGFK